MSAITRCNYCTYRELQKFAESTNQTAHLLPNAVHGGFDVVVLPVGVTPDPRYSQTPDGWAAWFMGISERCVC